MGELGEALVAMHAARHRFRTLKATIREWHDGPVSRLAAERYAESPEGQRSGFAEIVLERDEDDEGWQTSEGLWRLWVEKPDRVREERDHPLHGPELGIRDGERWWMYNPEYGPDSNEGDLSVGSGVGDSAEHLLDPSALLGPLHFAAHGRELIAGHEAIRLTGTVHSGRRHAFALMRLGATNRRRAKSLWRKPSPWPGSPSSRSTYPKSGRAKRATSPATNATTTRRSSPSSSASRTHRTACS